MTPINLSVIIGHEYLLATSTHFLHKVSDIFEIKVHGFIDII